MQKPFVSCGLCHAGDNVQGWRIAMTAPVRTRISFDSSQQEQDDNTWTVSFFLPYEYQVRTAVIHMSISGWL